MILDTRILADSGHRSEQVNLSILRNLKSAAEDERELRFLVCP